MRGVRPTPAPSSSPSLLKARRKSMGLSGRELSGEVGCSLNHLYRVENGGAYPSPRLARRIAGLLDSTEERLFPGGVGKPRNVVRTISKEPPTVLGAKLAKARLSHEWSQQQLARAAGLSRRAIQVIEHGTNKVIYPDTAHLLGKALGVGMDYFEPHVGGPNSTPDNPARAHRRTPLSRKLVGLRVDAGFSVSELARASGVNKQIIGDVESGKNAYSRNTAEKLAKVLGVQEEELLEERKRSVLTPDLVLVARAARGKPFRKLTFAEKVIVLREDRKLTRVALSASSRVGQNQIAAIERSVLDTASSGGEEVIGAGRVATAMTVRKFAAALGVEASELSREATITPLADALIGLRAHWGGSNRELSRLIGVHHQSLIAYENGWRCRLSNWHAQALGNFYGVSPERLHAPGSCREGESATSKP